MSKEKIICSECQKKGDKSKVFHQGGTSTLLGWSAYHDEDGIYHPHDPNRKTQYYECSHGHRFSINYLQSCPNCDYGEDSIIYEVTNGN